MGFKKNKKKDEMKPLAVEDKYESLGGFSLKQGE